MKYQIPIRLLVTLIVPALTLGQPSTDRNYVISNTVKRSGVTTVAQVNALSIQARQQEVNYFDGLGRPLQKVTSQVAPTGGDIIQPIEYDGFGREVKKFLPYAQQGTNIPGSFRSSAYTEQMTFYHPASSVDVAKDVRPVSQTFFEFSPLNRPVEVGSPGETWQPGSGKTVRPTVGVNRADEEVLRWVVMFDGVNQRFFPFVTNPMHYAANELNRSVVTDENDRRVISYTDQEGKTILKKVQIQDNPSPAHNGWLCTYYVYDELNRLRFVLQPRFVEDFLTHFSQPGDQILRELCFTYQYDEKGRMIRKQVPGSETVLMVYDARDRLVLTQDGNLRQQGRWQYTTYDNLNRPVSTGIWDNTTSFDTHRAHASNSTNYPVLSGTWQELTTNYYDDYSWIAANSVAGFSDTRSVADDALLLPANTAVTPFAEAVVQSIYTRGLATGSRTRVLGSTDWLYTATYFDNEGRPIQVRSMNVTGGIDETTTQYSFSGQPLLVVLRHRNNLSVAQTHITTTRNFYDDAGRLLRIEKKINNDVTKVILENTYDQLGQLKQKRLAPYFRVNAGIETLTHDYNIRGWLLGVNRNYLTTNGQSGSNRFGFELGYDRLTNNSGRNFSNPAQFNGNISGMVWKSDGDDTRRMYSFTYDAANRLMRADFIQHNNYSNDNNWGTNQMNYTVQMGNGTDAATAYDANGNIRAMTQFGWRPGAATTTPIDQLTYGYHGNSNRLRVVVDQQNNPTTNLGDFRTPTTHPQNASKSIANINSITDYSYDPNGNLIQDHNKAISTISYNHLNLPQTITVTGKGTITYTYDAAGTKLRKHTQETGASISHNGVNYTNISITTTVLYCAGFVYETKTYSNTTLQTALGYTNKLQFAGHEEGRIRALYNITGQPNTLNGFAYDYMVKDHLGNVRMVLTDERQVNYYPAATLEGTFSANNPQANSMVNHEKQFYNIQSNRIVNKPWTSTALDYPNHNNMPPGAPNPNYPAGVSPTQGATSARVYQLNGTTNRTGLELVMKVMAGDTIDILGRSYHTNTTPVSNSNSTSLNLLQMMTALLTAPVNAVASKGISASQLQTWNTGLLPSGFIRGNNNESGTSIPKAFVNYLFLDEQFKFAGGGWSRVGAGGSVKQHWNDGLQNINVPKNGYLFVYVSNESNFNVFFDNLQVVHKPGPLVEETHYYPFGLTMAGISSRALGAGGNDPGCGCPNKKGYNGNEIQNKEFADGSGLEVYDFNARTYDQQIGRFIQIDPLADEGNNYTWSNPEDILRNPTQNDKSPYASFWNNPILYNDPDGECPKCLKALAKTVVKSVVKGKVDLGEVHDMAEAVMTIASPEAGLLDKGLAVFDLLSPVSSKELKAGAKALGLADGANDANKALNTVDNVKNPYGAKGKPDHQKKVGELTDKAKAENPGMQVVVEKKINTQGSNRRPDVQVIDPETGKTIKVYEAERNPGSQRNKKREAEYKALGIPFETHKVGGK